MIVFLDQSLLDSLVADPSPLNSTAIAVDLATEAARQGTHVLCADIPTFDALIAHTEIFNARTRALLTRARAKSPFRQALRQGINWQVRLTNAVAMPTVQPIVGSPDEVWLPADSVAAQPGLLNKPKFIPENNNDGHFYEALVYSFIQNDPRYRNHFSSVKLQFDLVQGGGDTTGAVYAHHKALKTSFCLSVADSDQTHFNGPYGQTATKVLAVDRPPNRPEWNARSLVIKVRAVENLFPLKNLLETAQAMDVALARKTQIIIDSYSGQPHWNYLPLKTGLKCFDIKSLSTNEEKYLGLATKFRGCPNFSAELCESSAKCETVVVEPLGTGLLAKICSIKPIQLKLDLIVDALAIPSIRDLCVEMVSAFCGEDPILGA